MSACRGDGRMSLRVKLHVLIIVTLLFGLFVPYGVREAAAAPAPLVYDFAQMGLKKKDNTVQPTGSNNHNLALIGDQTSVLPKVYGGNYGVSIESSLTQTTRSFSFDVPVGGLYAITLKAALSTDGGIADIYLDQYGNPGGGTKLFAGFEFYKNATDSVFRTLNGASSVLLAAGTHTITFTVIARKLSSGPAYMFPYVLTLTEQPITASPANATFNKDAPADINVAMSVYQSLVSIQNGAQLLVPGTDYIAGDYQVTLKKEYLSTLETGAVPLTFDVVYGTQPQVTVNVTDPAPETLFLDLAQLSLTDPGTGWYLTKLNPGTYPR
ncbi:MAG: hypothetical protein J7559_02695, partial [Cohnella sp.]|nr:hypothetical protein [Cohnella sp.]